MSFLLLTCFLVTKRLEGHCVDFQFFNLIEMENHESKIRIPSCRSNQKKVRLDYLQYKKLELLNQNLKEVDRILGLVFNHHSIKPIKVYVTESSNNLLSNDQIVISYRHIKNNSLFPVIKSALFSGVLQKLENQLGADLHIIEKKLTAELITHFMMSLLGISEKPLASSQNEWVYLIRPPLKKMICQSPTRSIVIHEFCQRSGNIESAWIERLAIQDFIINLISYQVNVVTPLKRIEILHYLKGDWLKFDSRSKILDVLAFDQLLNSEQKKWIQSVFDFISRIIGPQLDSVAINLIQNNVTLIEVDSNLDQLDFSNFASDVILVKKGEYEFGLSKMGYYRITDGSPIKELVQFQCHPPIVRDLIQLPQNIARVTVIEYCDTDLNLKVQKLSEADLSRFLRDNRNLGYFQVHLPSLRWLNERNAINPFILIEMGAFDHPLFHSIGWKSATYSEETHSYSVHAAIEVVQKFRPSIKSMEVEN
jgi:hypothetical protein